MSKAIAEQSKGISITWLKQHRYFKGRSFGSIVWTNWDDSKSTINLEVDTDALTVRFKYTQTNYFTDEVREMEYVHGLETTPCNYGGQRYWFVCRLTVNGRFCGRRVGVLYKSPGSWYWGCRHCHRIAYESQNQDRNFLFGVTMDYRLKAEELVHEIKRWYWRGLPTKKHRKLIQYSEYLKRLSPLLLKDVKNRRITK